MSSTPLIILTSFTTRGKGIWDAAGAMETGRPINIEITSVCWNTPCNCKIAHRWPYLSPFRDGWSCPAESSIQCRTLSFNLLNAPSMSRDLDTTDGFSLFLKLWTNLITVTQSKCPRSRTWALLEISALNQRLCDRLAKIFRHSKVSVSRWAKSHLAYV